MLTMSKFPYLKICSEVRALNYSKSFDYKMKFGMYNLNGLMFRKIMISKKIDVGLSRSMLNNEKLGQIKILILMKASLMYSCQ